MLTLSWCNEPSGVASHNQLRSFREHLFPKYINFWLLYSYSTAILLPQALLCDKLNRIVTCLEINAMAPSVSAWPTLHYGDGGQLFKM